MPDRWCRHLTHNRRRRIPPMPAGRPVSFQEDTEDGHHYRGGARRAARSSAEQSPRVEAGYPDLAGGVLRVLRPVPDRLRRPRYGQARSVLPRLAWHIRCPGAAQGRRSRHVRVRIVRRAVGRHHSLRLGGGRLRPPLHLYVLAAVVLRQHADHGVSDHRLRHRPVALHRRHRHRRGAGDDRHLHLRADPAPRPRPCLRHQPVHRLPRRAGGGLPRLDPGAGALALGGGDRRDRRGLRLVGAAGCARVAALARPPRAA